MEKELNDQENKNNIPDSRIDEHLRKKDDLISEEDIAKMKTDIRSPGTSPVGQVNDEVTGNEDEKIEKSKKEMPNTWDIMDETT